MKPLLCTALLISALIGLIPAQVQLGNDINGQAFESIGERVDISDDGTRIAAGHGVILRVFEWNGSSWNQLGPDLPNVIGGSINVGSGIRFSKDGNRLGAFSSTGGVSVYEFDGTNWVLLGTAMTVTAGMRMVSLDLSDDGTVVSVAWFEDGAGLNTFDFHLSVFELVGGSYVQKGTDRIFNSLNYGYFLSTSISGDGSRVSFSMPILTGNEFTGTTPTEGEVVVYDFSGTDWVVSEVFNSPGSGLRLGLATALSDDGSHLAISTPEKSEPVEVYAEQGGVWTQVGTGFTDYAGEQAISISDDGSIVAIGNRGFVNSLGNVGKIQLYELQGGNWSKKGSEILGSDGISYFGTGLALNGAGSRLVGGAPFFGGLQYYGQVRVFEFPASSSSFNQVGLDIDGLLTDINSGYDIALSQDGRRVAIGTKSSSISLGIVRVYEEQGGNWTQLGQDMIREVADLRFGGYLALSAAGDVIAVGDHTDDTNGADAGSVSVYRLSGGTWMPEGQVILGDSPGDQAGVVSLSDDGSILAIGSPFSDSPFTNAGRVQVYQHLGGSWTQLGNTLSGSSGGDNFGTTVSLNAFGTRLVVGSPGVSTKATVYEYAGGNWTQLGSEILGAAPIDGFGGSVSMSAIGNRVAIGGGDNYVRVFEWVAGAWTQMGTDIFGDDPNSFFGESISLSDDGLRLVVGARQHTGAPGANSGMIRLYEYNGSSWGQLGMDIEGEATTDRFGYHTAISGDGLRIAGSSIFNDGVGPDAGHTRVFELGGATTSISATEDRRFHVFPNPAKDVVTISLIDGLQDQDLTVGLLDVHGKPVIHPMNVPRGRESYQLALSGIPAGMYFLRLVGAEQVMTRPLVVQ